MFTIPKNTKNFSLIEKINESKRSLFQSLQKKDIETCLKSMLVYIDINNIIEESIYINDLKILFHTLIF